MTNNLIINRLPQTDNQTNGLGYVVDEAGNTVFEFKTLELPDRNNQKRISRIPSGSYTVVKRVSPKFGLCFHVLDVPNRSYILLHAGNYHYHTLGCILVGSKAYDLNSDGELDTVNSKKTIKTLLGLLPNSFNLLID